MRPLLITSFGMRGTDEAGVYTWVELADGTRRRMTTDEKAQSALLPDGSKVFRLDNMTSQSGGETTAFLVEIEGKRLTPGHGYWKTNGEGMERLIGARRVVPSGTTLAYVRYIDDFPVYPVANLWTDTGTGSFTDPKIYAVQTGAKVIQRCILMTTDPGDLVFDPTCGSGTTAYVAEKWGRRWITIDTSRVPLALSRQRLLTATFPYYELSHESRGPASGFVYKRKQNKKGEEIGGIVPHITLKSIANNEPPQEEVLVDRPETISNILRVSGPFSFEATIPTPIDWEGDGIEDSGTTQEDYSSFIDRMLEVLRRCPVLNVEGNRKITLKNVRPPAKSLSLHAEAIVPNGEDQLVAVVFGPENGAVSEKLVYEAAKEGSGKRYKHLYVIGFAIQANARKLIEQCDQIMGIPATYVQATPDLMMGDLLKNMRSSQIFSVCGLPEVELRKTKDGKFQVGLLGLDTFDPATMEVEHKQADDVPAWFLDTNYNGLCFHVCQAFFPRTSAWESLKKALKADYEEGIWEHLSGTTSAPFEPGESGEIAVKVIDDRGNELLVVKKVSEAE